VLESGPFVSLSAKAGSKREAIRGGINSLPEPPDNRREDLAAGNDPARRQRGRPWVLMANEPRLPRGNSSGYRPAAPRGRGGDRGA
jgi:hypothetical protein